jgi:glycosyltransferase involved in cell wall biosynthesis
MTNTSFPKARIYHNILWARYKGAIFSRMHADSDASELNTEFIHVAETSRQRLTLGNVDRSYHEYPYEVLFRGSYESIPFRKLVTALIANLFKHPSDLVVLPGYHRPEYWAMLFTCMLLRRKRAVWVDSTAYDRKKSRLKELAKRFFFKSCDGFFCYGIRSKEYVASYGIDERKIYFRCQAAALPHDYDAAAVRRHYQGLVRAENHAPRYIYIGRLSSEKGLFDLIDAFANLTREMSAARLDIVGSGVLEQELKGRARQIGLESAIDFLGSQSAEEIGQLLMRSSALVLPSRSEPWGLVVNEALSFGCPVVVSEVCGCVPELVIEGSTGYSFPSGDIPALTAAMVKAAALSVDRPAVANTCMGVIGQYTSDRAALEILSGCVRIIKATQ